MRGDAKMNLKDMLGAVVDYTLAISMNHQSAEAYLKRGLAKIAVGTDRPGACKDFTLAVQLGSKAAAEASAQYCK